MAQPKRNRRPVNSADTPTPDVAALAAAVEADRNQRAQAAIAEIDAVLARHRCKLGAAPHITADGRIEARPTITALD